MSSSIEFAGSDTVNGIIDDKFELQFALGKPVVDHQSLENHTPTSRHGFSIRGYVAQLRSKDISKCWPFSEGLLQLSLKDGDNPLLPPLDSAEHGTNGLVSTERETLSQTQSTVCEEKDDGSNSEIMKASLVEAQECSVKAPSLEENGRNSVEASNSPPMELDHILVEAPRIIEISNAKENTPLNNRQVEDYDIGDETKTETETKCAGSEEVEGYNGGDTLEKGPGLNVCPVTTNDVNAHMDNCLRSPSEEKKQGKIMSSKSKAQKKRRSIADIFASAPPVQIYGTTSSLSMSEKDIFETTNPCPRLPLHCTDAVSALESAKASPFECGKAAELLEPHRLDSLQVGSKSKCKRKRAPGKDRRDHCSSSSTRLKEVIKSVVKNPRRQKTTNASDTISYINPEAEVSQETNRVPMKNNKTGKRSRIASRKKYLKQFHASLLLHQSKEHPQEKQIEKLQLQDVVVEERSSLHDVSVPNSDKKKRRRSVKQQKKEPPKKQKPDMFVRDSKGRFASVPGKGQTKKHRQKGCRRLRRESRASVNLCDSSIHKDTNFAINLALSNARVFNATNRTETPSPCIDANRSSNSIINAPQIPDLNALDGTVSQIKQAGSTPASTEVSLQKKNDKFPESSMMNMKDLGECLGLVVTAQSRVPESIIGKCAASSPTADSEKHRELQLVNKMNSGTTVRMHQNIPDDSAKSRTDACRHGGQDLFIASTTPCMDKTVDECQNNKKVVRLMGKSLVVDAELPPLVNRGSSNNNINVATTHGVPTKHLIFEQLHSKEHSSVNNAEAINEINLLEAMDRNTPAREAMDRNTPAREPQDNTSSAEEPENNTSLKQPDTAEQSRPLGRALPGDGSSKQTSLATATPPLSSRPVWLVSKETGFNSGKSDFVRSRFSMEQHGRPREYGLERQPKKKVSFELRDNSYAARPPRTSRLSGRGVDHRSAAAHSIPGEHLYYSPSGCLVKDGQPATLPPTEYTSSANISHVAVEKEKTAPNPGCSARDYSSRQLHSDTDFVYPLCVYDSISAGPSGLVRGFLCMQTNNNNNKAIISPFAYSEPRAFSLGETELKAPKEKRCITDNGRTVNLIGTLNEAPCKSVCPGQSLSGKPLGNQIEMESSSAGQVTPSCVIDLTNDSEGESDDDPCFTYVEANRFHPPHPNRGLGNGEAAKYPIHCRSRKLIGGAKHILKPSTYSSSDNTPLPVHYIFPFALPEKKNVC